MYEDNIENIDNRSWVNWVFLFTLIIYLGASEAIALLWHGNAPIVLRLVIGQLILILPAVLYVIFNERSFTESVGLHKVRVGTILLTPVVTAFLMPLMIFANAFSMLFTDNKAEVLIDAMGDQPIGIALVLSALVPAIFEENVYRGVFFSEYRRFAPLRGALLSGLLFGLLHLNLNQFCYAFLFGVVLAIIVEATGSIIPTIFIHCMINSGSIILSYVLPKIQELLWAEMPFDAEIEAELAITPEYVLALGRSALIPTIIAGVLIWAMAAIEGRTEKLRDMFAGKGRGERLMTWPLALAIVICVGCIVLRLLEDRGMFV